jgi:hypothetical protein
MGEMRNAHAVSVGKPGGRDHFGDLGIDGKIILKLVSMKQIVRVWIELN